MKERLSDDLIGMRAARELKPGAYCNLGIGIPQLAAQYLPEGVLFECENGALGYGPLVTIDNWEEADYGNVDAGGRFFTEAPGMSYFDMLTSFNMIRSGRLITILGGLQVSEKGDLANYSLGEADEYPQIGGAMDLAWGAKKLIVAMTHTTRDDKFKIVKECGLPLTIRERVNLIITDLAVIEVVKAGLVLKEVAPGWTIDEVQALTEPQLLVTEEPKEIEV